MKYCPDCKHFIYCDFGKMILYKSIKEDCPEFEERKKKDDTQALHGVR